MAVPIKVEAEGVIRIGPLTYVMPSGRTGSGSTFLVMGSERAMVVEPGLEGRAPQIVEAIQSGLALDRVEYIWASHIHVPHIQSVPTLLKELPQAKFLVHPQGAPHVINPTRLIESTNQVYGDKRWELMNPMPADRVMVVEDGQVFDLGGKQVEIIHSPGHAPHHMGLFDRQTRVLFPGDLDAGLGSFGAPDGSSPTRFDPTKFVNSMRRYQALHPSMLLMPPYPKSLPAEDTLRDAEVDILAIERICREGMREKLSLAEIDRRAREWEKWAPPVHPVVVSPTGGVGPEMGGGAPPHLLAYLKRKYPELKIPS